MLQKTIKTGKVYLGLIFFMAAFSVPLAIEAEPLKILPILMVNLEPSVYLSKRTVPSEAKPLVLSDSKKDSAKIDFSGSTEFGASLDTDDNHSSENLTSFKNRTIIKADYKQFSVSGISDYLYFGDEDKNEDYDLGVYEMYVRYNTPSWDFILGKQIKRWGKTDQVSPVDTLNPENITEFITPSYEDRKIPVWMADITFRKDDFFVEGVLIPFFEPSRFHYFGTDWAVFSHLKNDIRQSSLAAPLKSYFESMSVNEAEPDSGFDSFEYALRVGGTIDRLDYGFTYHYANEDLPYFKSFPVKNLSLDNPGSVQSLLSDIGSLSLTNEHIETTYSRTHIAGFEFETTLADFGVRGEAAVKDNESFLTRALTSVRNPSLFWVVGADYLSSNQWYFNLQFAHQHIYDYDSSILYFEDNNYSLIGEIKKDLVSDWLNASVQFTRMLNDNSYYLSPRLKYTYIRNLEIMMGLNLFGGKDTTILGRYDENDQVFLHMKYHF
ncbi:MAG: hypothetical protein A2464_08240 [Deltaproteobacteria bacterium RIFOXYC2_FULL_48_10]|nr:MAG: hypothetical protein A2464_08240 [Deltaproteobacteria bacterium RIFOXYC2_FULL_48_10]OGR60311.1 MAG: hypothetical protein A3J80_01720 [Desulfobacula sp. RIFOXYB2_FULL_45_6]